MDVAPECFVSVVNNDETFVAEVVVLTSVVDSSFSVDGVVTSEETSAAENVVVGASWEDLVVECGMTLVFRVDIPSAPNIVVASCEVRTAESSEEACNNGVVSSLVISEDGVSAKTVDMSEDVVTFDGILDRGVVVVASLDIPVD